MRNPMHHRLVMLALICAVLLAVLLDPLGKNANAGIWNCECNRVGDKVIDCLYDCSINGIRYYNVYEGTCQVPSTPTTTGICYGWVTHGCTNVCP
jgi:hypothetical protein